MQRRQFLAGCAAAGLSSFVHLPAWAEELDPYFLGFRKGLPDHPWLGAFAGVDRRMGGTVRLYDLSKDPTEKHNLAKEQPELAEQLIAKRKQFLESSTLPLDQADKANQDELDRLRALGYVD